MSSLAYEILASTSLFTLGLYHLISTTRHFHKSPREYLSKPFHSLSFTTSHLRHLPLYLTIAALSTSFLHHSLSSTSPDPLLPSQLHLFSSLQSAALSLLFLLISLSLLLSDSPSSFISPLPYDLLFALLSAAFFLHSSVSSSSAAANSSALESHFSAVSARVSGVSSLLSLSLAFFPRVFAADVALAGTVLLQGLWALQKGMSLYVDGFVPEGCHRLLDVVSGVEGSTKCDLDESRVRAVAMLDFAFVVYVVVVVVVVVVVYGVVAKVVGSGGGGGRRLGAYEALPNSGGVDNNHVQLKTLSGTQA